MPTTEQRIRKIIIMLGKAALTAVILVGVCSYVYFCPPVLTSTNGGFLLYPLPPGDEYKFESINNIKREEVWFKNNQGAKLHAWYFQNPDKNAPVILFSHGNAGNIGHRLMLAKCLLDAGASVFLFDYRSFGKSEGTKNLQGIADDSRAAYDYLVVNRKIPTNKVVLYGESIGGGPTCDLASKVQAGGVILDSTFTSLLHVAKKKVAFFNIYPDFLQPIPAMNNISVLQGKHAPLLIIHGQLDEVIPISEANENFQSASDPKRLLTLPNSTHNWKEPDFPLYVKGVHEFLKQIESNNAILKQD